MSDACLKVAKIIDLKSIVVIILQYIQLKNHIIVHLKLVLYINYTSIEKKQNVSKHKKTLKIV